ncbi:MAG: hypothetical protein HC806_06295 [Anaerolineae bacterium]|nr:hypothetical protein [Anaerolineae bacterium]
MLNPNADRRLHIPRFNRAVALTIACAPDEQIPELELISTEWRITCSLLRWSCNMEESPGARYGAYVVPAER